MADKEQIIARITPAFADVKHPGDWCLRGSNDVPVLISDFGFNGRKNPEVEKRGENSKTGVLRSMLFP